MRSNRLGSNRLADETSPYLKQHADNPVNWYPWGAEALELAAREHKPILLSIGYSACHWCHVMAHESFEDSATAEIMNAAFVNIKVDREERPDLDRIYQLAQQLLTQHAGGWPLTMFLTPEDQHPFFGGTYFPKEPRAGMPAFRDILRRVADYYRSHAEEIRRQNTALTAAFAALAPEPSPADHTLGEQPLAAARSALERAFDTRYGGFSRAPKFPQVASIERCLRQWYGASRTAAPDLKALYMATLTLTRMGEGGLFDQLGGGFARYSVDEFWMIPHFEKMLYDNGQLLHCYAMASLATGEALFARVAGETADWLLRDMRSADGAFYSSLDADSAGPDGTLHEGAFYVWTPAEVDTLLPPAAAAVFVRRFGLDRPANFEGRWHLHVHEPLDAAAVPDAVTRPDATALLDSARATLLTARNQRIWPARDEKILTSWNALAIKGLAAAGRVLDRPDLTAAADAALAVTRRTLWRDGRLLATQTNGRGHLAAYLDDYAFLADALLELLQTRWRSADLAWAIELVEVVLAQFEDRSQGGFFFTAADHERLILRTKTFNDDSLPSGNGIATAVLCRLGYLLGETRYLDAAERTLLAAGRQLEDQPRAHMSMLNALEEFLTSAHIVIVRGSAAETTRWARSLQRLYAPTRLIFAIPDDSPDLPAALAAKTAVGGTTAYVCTGMTCGAPLNDLDAVARRLTL